MPEIVNVDIAKPIGLVELLDHYSPDMVGPLQAEILQADLLKELQIQKDAMASLVRAIRTAEDKLTTFYTNLFSEHKDQIAKLSMEIARKVLHQKIKEKDYEIETIIRETLSNAPSQQNAVVRLNPDDFNEFQKILEDSQNSFEAIQFLPHEKLSRAECIVETPKGVVESFVHQQLETIEKALMKA